MRKLTEIQKETNYLLKMQKEINYLLNSHQELIIALKRNNDGLQEMNLLMRDLIQAISRVLSK